MRDMNERLIFCKKWEFACEAVKIWDKLMIRSQSDFKKARQWFG
jgi:hypothetical protein